MKNKLFCLITLLVFLLPSCTKRIAIPQESSTTASYNSDLNLLDREEIKSDRAELISVLGNEAFEGKSISVKLCVNASGNIVYAELLKETTVSIPAGKEKAVLKSRYGYKFSSSDKMEECGLVIVR